MGPVSVHTRKDTRRERNIQRDTQRHTHTWIHAWHLLHVFIILIEVVGSIVLALGVHLLLELFYEFVPLLLLIRQQQAREHLDERRFARALCVCQAG